MLRTDFMEDFKAAGVLQQHIQDDKPNGIRIDLLNAPPSPTRRMHFEAGLRHARHQSVSQLVVALRDQDDGSGCRRECCSCVTSRDLLSVYTHGLPLDLRLSSFRQTKRHPVVLNSR